MRACSVLQAAGPNSQRLGGHTAWAHRADGIRREIGLSDVLAQSGWRLYVSSHCLHGCERLLMAVLRCAPMPSYGSPQAAFKLHPDFDHVLLHVLELDPEAAVVVLLDTNGIGRRRVLPRLQRAAVQRWCSVAQGTNSTALHGTAPSHDLASSQRADTRLPGLPPAPQVGVLDGIASRLARGARYTASTSRGPGDAALAHCMAMTHAVVEHRVRFLPRLSHQEYLLLLQSLDVALDTWPFGGGLTSFQLAAVAHTPVVTLPSHMRSGRLTQAMLRRLGCHAEVAPGVRLVVNSGINMARSAVAIATNTSIRASVSEVLRVGAAASTSDGRHQETLREWRRFLQFAREVAANT